MIRNPFNRFICFPTVHPEGDWDLRVGSGATEVWLRTLDKVDLNAWWFGNADGRFATLFLHGNAGNITHRINHAEAITEAGSSVLMLDYRGYGKSGGLPGEAGLYRDADAGYDELLKRGYDPEQIIVHGESLGTAVAVELAARRLCAGVVLEAPFISLGQAAGLILPVVGPWLVRGYDSKAKIGKVTARILIVHGRLDEVIPLSHGEELFRLAKEPKRFWRVEAAHHNDIVHVAGMEYRQRLREFYDCIRSNN